jgi:hypothetical protein
LFSAYYHKPPKIAYKDRLFKVYKKTSLISSSIVETNYICTRNTLLINKHLIKLSTQTSLYLVMVNAGTGNIVKLFLLPIGIFLISKYVGEFRNRQCLFHSWTVICNF